MCAYHVAVVKSVVMRATIHQSIISIFIISFTYIPSKHAHPMIVMSAIVPSAYIVSSSDLFMFILLISRAVGLRNILCVADPI